MATRCGAGTTRNGIAVAGVARPHPVVVTATRLCPTRLWHAARMRVFIIGMHRSGTSLATRTVERLGLWAGEEHHFHPPTEHDPEGHREYIAVHTANERALATVGASWDDPPRQGWDFIPDADRRALRAAMAEVVAELDMHCDWVVKDPRLCLTLPLWKEVVHPACIYVHRDPLQVARSLAARDRMPINAGLALWEVYARHALREMAELDLLVIDHEGILTGAVMEPLHRWLSERMSVPPRHGEVAPIDAALRRQHTSPGEANALLTPSQARLLRAIEAKCSAHGDADALLAQSLGDDVSAASTELLHALASYRARLAELERRDHEISVHNAWLLSHRSQATDPQDPR